MDTDVFTDESTPLTSASRLPPQSPERDNEFSAAEARLVDRVAGILPDDVIRTYVLLGRTQCRLRKLVAASKRRVVTNRKKIAKVRATIRAMQDRIDTLKAEIEGKEYDIERYQDGLSGVYTLRRLVEQGEFCVKRPQIIDLPLDEDN
jgi:hypothetical protein